MNYDTIKNWTFPDVEQAYTETDAILYALGVGYGCDPLDDAQLRFVLENNLRATPTMAVVLAYPWFWLQDPAAGIDWRKAVGGEISLELHATLPASGTVVSRRRVTGIVDKGASKGSIIYIERLISHKQTGELLATVNTATFCRGDGGLDKSDPVSTTPPAMPDGPPDAVCELPTMPQAALVYRLSGDRNPLHSEPAAARAAGFERPILHGLATYGLVGHALLKTFCAYDPARLSTLSARFSSPVFPGDTIRTEMWRRGDQVYCRAISVQQNVVVLNNGIANLKSA